MRVLLIYPPHTRNTEPPLGVAMVAADLASAGVEASLLDLNAVAAPHLAQQAPDGADHRTHRAVLHLTDSIAALRAPALYGHPSRYRTQIEYYAEACRAVSREHSWRLTPGDFTDTRFGDFGLDVVRAATADPAASPFFPCFERFVAPRVASYASHAPDVIGISVIYRSQFLPGLALAAWLAVAYPQVRLVLGGGFFLALPDDVVEWCDTNLGGTVVGEGEGPLRALLGLPAAGASPFCDPRFEGIDWSVYFAPEPVLPLTASRGCYWARCAFCAESAWRFVMDRPLEFHARLERLVAQHRPGIVHLTDNAIPPAILTQLAERGSPAPWYGFVRPEPRMADRAFVDALARSGCAMLQLGLETPVPRLLDVMQKGVDPATFGPILENLRRAGIRSYVYLLFGFPGQTLEDAEESRAFLGRFPVDFLNASIFRLPPEAHVAREPEKYCVSFVGGSAATDLYRPFEAPRLGAGELRRWLSRRFFRDAAVRAPVARTPRYFKSNHAVYCPISTT